MSIFSVYLVAIVPHTLVPQSANRLCLPLRSSLRAMVLPGLCVHSTAPSPVLSHHMLLVCTFLILQNSNTKENLTFPFLRKMFLPPD